MINILLIILLIIIAILIVINICFNSIGNINDNRFDLKNNIKGGMIIKMDKYTDSQGEDIDFVPHINSNPNSIYTSDYLNEFFNGTQLLIAPHITRIGNGAFALPESIFIYTLVPSINSIKFADRENNQPELNIGNSAFENNNIQGELIIPSFIKNIEYGAFRDNDRLTDVICIDGYKKNEDVLTIYDNAFEGCGIKLAILPQQFDNDEELRRIGIDLSNIEKVILWGSEEYNNHPIIKDETFKRRGNFAAFASGLKSIPKGEISIEDGDAQSAIIRQQNVIASFL